MASYLFLRPAACCLAATLLTSPAWAHEHGDTPYGRPGVAAQAMRTVAVTASDDMRFTPARIAVRRGETIRFVISNHGKLRHEFSLGTRQELVEHYAVMKKFPDMVHEEANKISLEPGARGEVVWHFTRAGNAHFACLQVGHYEAGMKGQVQISR